MKELVTIATDLTAIAVLTFCIYFPRHHRRDLVAAFLTVNACVLAVAMVLSSSTVGMGLGLGLFGVLSIIRLRSSEIEQHEVAYYFSALALALLAGLPKSVSVLTGGLMLLIILMLAVGDHPRLFARYRQQTVRLDVAYTDEQAIVEHLALLLGGRIVNLSVKQVDLVNDSTLVDVRYLASRTRVLAEPAPRIAQEAKPTPRIAQEAPA